MNGKEMIEHTPRVLNTCCEQLLVKSHACWNSTCPVLLMYVYMCPRYQNCTWILVSSCRGRRNTSENSKNGGVCVAVSFPEPPHVFGCFKCGVTMKRPATQSQGRLVKRCACCGSTEHRIERCRFPRAQEIRQLTRKVNVFNGVVNWLNSGTRGGGVAGDRAH